MNKRTGFTLIELLIYMALFGFSAYVMISSNTLLAQWSSWVVERQHGQLQQLLLGDIVMRDVVAASYDLQCWAPEQGIFRKQFLDQHNKPVAYDVGYECSAGRCMRLQGVFDYKTKIWQKRQRSVLAQGGVEKIMLTPITCVINNKAVVQRVEVVLVSAFSRPSDITHSTSSILRPGGSEWQAGRADRGERAVTKTYRVRSQVVPYAR